MGSIPTGYLIAKSHDVDIRSHGSGNIGATNVGRTLGWKFGMIVGLLDWLKAYIVAKLVIALALPIAAGYLVMLMPIFGHIFSPWLGFKGGKGVSTIFGVLAGVLGLKIFAIWLVVWLVYLKLTKLMSLVNISLALMIPILFWFNQRDWIAVGYGLSLTAIIWLTHRTNIKRLINGNENRLHI